LVPPQWQDHDEFGAASGTIVGGQRAVMELRDFVAQA
jgi:hypothetical protein